MMLKVDVDTRRKLSRRALLQRARIAQVELVGVTDLRSPSGRGWHRYLVVRPAPRTALETVALQLLFGSDPIREAFNICRARLVDRKQVSLFWRRRFNTLYDTSKGKPLHLGKDAVAAHLHGKAIRAQGMGTR